MTIHHENPFVDPPASRDALRQFRGRMPAPVTVVATGESTTRTGLTVSSLVVVPGDPDHVVAMVDPDSDLGARLTIGAPLTVSILGPDDAYLAEAFAGLAPAPGGLFRLGAWVQTAWGPVIEGATWLGATVSDVRTLGWAHEVVALVEMVGLARSEAIVHHRGRYLTVDDRDRRQ